MPHSLPLARGAQTSPAAWVSREPGAWPLESNRGYASAAIRSTNSAQRVSMATQSKLEAASRIGGHSHRSRALIALLIMVVALGHKQIQGALHKHVHLERIRLNNRKKVKGLSLEEGLEQLYVPTGDPDGSVTLYVPDHGHLAKAKVTPTPDAVYKRDYDHFSLPPPLTKEAAKKRLQYLTALGGVTPEIAQKIRVEESKLAPEAGESVTSASAMRVGVDREFFRQVRALLRIIFPSIYAKEVYMFVAHTCFLVLRTYLSLLVARLDGYLVKSLISADLKGFLRGLGMWAALAVPATYTNAMIRFLQSKLSLAFRTRLTRYVHDLYLNQHQNFYKVMNLDNRLEAVGQYITHDIAHFSDVISDLYSNISKPILDMIIFMWQIGNNVGFSGVAASMLGYAASSYALRSVSPPFGKLAAVEAKLEGNFYNAHSRMIINAEEIAFYNGASTEEGILRRSYRELVRHIKSILRARVGYNSMEDFVLKYSWSAFGYVIMAVPAFSAHDKSDGNVSNDPSIAKHTEGYISNRRILLALADAGSRLMYSYKGIATLAGQTSRVYSLISSLHLLQHDDYQSVKRPADLPADQPFFDLGHLQGKIIEDMPHVKFTHAPIVTPAPSQERGGDLLVSDLNLQVNPGDHIQVTGPNGVGKTAIARVLAGLWPLFDGQLEKPLNRDMMFLPQRPLLTTGSLREQIIYPNTYQEHLESGRTNDDLMDILKHVHLAYLPEREGGWTTRKEWKDVLSGGEKQRMGMARLFYHLPKYAVLDECTSAVSTDVEGLMYAHAKDLGITLITISHRPTLFKYHQWLLDIKGHDDFEIINLAGDSEQLTIDQEIAELEAKVTEVDVWKNRLAEIQKELSFSRT